MNEALAAALEKKSVAALKKALEAKPDLSALDWSGLSALHLAVKGKKLDLAEALLAAGADITRRRSTSRSTRTRRTLRCGSSSSPAAAR